MSNKAIRVLHVISGLEFGNGISNFVMNYFRNIGDGIKFDFLLFEGTKKDFCPEVERLGGRAYYIEQPSLKNIVGYNKILKNFFAEHKNEWDIVHIHEILIQRFIRKNSKKYGGVKKVIVHSHMTNFVLPIYGVSAVKNISIKLYKRLRNKILFSHIKRSDYLFACSKEAGIALYGKKTVKNEKKFYIIKNAIDSERFFFNSTIREQYRNELNLQDKKVIIQVGRLCEQKNQIFSLEVLKHLTEFDDKYVLLLVGSGRLQADVENAIKKLQLEEHVILAGERADVMNMYQCADLSILPSIAEGLGIALIEAQASGLPCIASTDVPQAACVTPYVQFLDLSTGSKVWAEEISKTKLERYDAMRYIIDSGYDIKTSAKKVSALYYHIAEADA